MEYNEIIGLAFLAFTLVFALGIMWRFKKMKDSRKALDAKFDAISAKLNTKGDSEGVKEIQRAKVQVSPNKREIAKRYGTISQTQSVSGNSVGIQSRGSTTTVVNDSSSDMLTNILLYKMMADHNTNSVGVKYDDDTGSVRITTRETEPETKHEESSYPSSYSSSSDDSRSSYSSSYSSSSSDDSYSSGSSDSSYSSSYSSD